MTAGATRRTLALTALALGAIAYPAAAKAQEPEPLLTPEAASAALDDAVDAVTGEAPPTTDLTEELRNLAVAVPYLEGAERRRARAILARPPASGGDAGAQEGFGAEWSQKATNTRDSYTDGQFRVHWVEVTEDAPSLADGGDPGNIPDYVELVAAYANDSFDTQNTDLGWPEPKSDGNRGGGSGLTDVYLSDLCCESGILYGYASADDPSAECNGPPFRCFAYLVLDNNYAELEYGYGGDPDIPLSVTTAHEYNHILQFRLDAFQDFWMFESTAVWAEEKTFPDADDWLVTYMDDWARTSTIPVTKGRKWYGTGVWNHWLELGAGFGPGVILDSWEKSRQSEPKDYAVGAYDLGIKENGGSSFGRVFARFAAATAEWRLNNGDFADEEDLPSMRRRGKLRRRGPAARFELDHLSFRLFKVLPRGANTIRLRLKAERGVRCAIALVGLDGGQITGVATTRFKYSGKGGKRKVSLTGARGFDRITAMVVNADGRVHGFGGSDWNYTRDDSNFRVSVR